MGNNKAIGNAFESEFVSMLAKRGFWAHFIAPNRQGAQPFDVIAIKDGKPWAFDCKTSVREVFPLTRLEDNQAWAFEKIIKCGCENVFVAVKYGGKIYLLPYVELKAKRTIKINESYLFEEIIH